MSAGKGKGKTRGGIGGGRDGGISSKDSASQRQSRSRNTTPASTAMSENTLMSGELSLSPQVSYGDILDKYVTSDTSIPASVTLNALASDLKALSSSAARQAAACRARMAELTDQVPRKQTEEKERERREDEEREKSERKRREREERRVREGEDGVKRKKNSKDKDKHHHHGHSSKHPPTHGAHQLTSQAPDSIPGEYTPIHHKLRICHLGRLT